MTIRVNPEWLSEVALQVAIELAEQTGQSHYFNQFDGEMRESWRIIDPNAPQGTVIIEADWLIQLDED